MERSWSGRLPFYGRDPVDGYTESEVDGNTTTTTATAITTEVRITVTLNTKLQRLISVRQTYGYLQANAGTKLCCSVTEAHACERLVQGCYPTPRRQAVEPATCSTE